MQALISWPSSDLPFAVLHIQPLRLCWDALLLAVAWTTWSQAKINTHRPSRRLIIHCYLTMVSAGHIELATLQVYIKAMGGPTRFLLIMSWLVLVEVCRVGSTVWLSHWTNVANRPQGAPHTALWYLAIYAGISGVQVGCLVASILVLSYAVAVHAQCCMVIS